MRISVLIVLVYLHGNYRSSKYDRDEPMPEDFPREVYGKALLAGWIANMTLLPSILNILYLERGLVDDTISPQNVTNQMVGHNVDYEIIKSYGSNLMLTGSWEYRNFLALFEKRRPWKCILTDLSGFQTLQAFSTL
ncbi:unnamed protein product [Caenorhabditis sp. 36 PRJEB53466]|nr:unnamed protein product [Caenorhabditis sp. 36 PRJEB53466]